MGRLKRIGSKPNGNCAAKSHQSKTADVSWGGDRANWLSLENSRKYKSL